LGWSISFINDLTWESKVLVPFDIGVVYITLNHEQTIDIVLVPFDIGVVYITIFCSIILCSSFSPLRYWGGLYR